LLRYDIAAVWRQTAVPRARAKAGARWTISFYPGRHGQFDEGMGRFALAYAHQAERDQAAPKPAVRTGIIDM
jgi:hypothetical protein